MRLAELNAQAEKADEARTLYDHALGLLQDYRAVLDAKRAAGPLTHIGEGIFWDDNFVDPTELEK